MILLKKLLTISVTYVYNRGKEQKLREVFSERVPASTRIFYAKIDWRESMYFRTFFVPKNRNDLILILF